MNLSDLRKSYAEFNQQIENIKTKRDIFRLSNRMLFDELFIRQKKENFEWFVNHFDSFVKHKDYICQSEILRNVIIDFIPVCKICCRWYGTEYNCFTLGNLFELWDAGFTYNGQPVITCLEYRYWNPRKCITVIENGKLRHINLDNSFLTNEMRQLISQKSTQVDFWQTYRTIDVFKKMWNK